MIDYKEIVENLQVDKVISLMEQLGDKICRKKMIMSSFPTICHNENADEASMKLYFYKDTKLFVCYTECGNMSIFKFLKHYYEARQVEYDWRQDIFRSSNQLFYSKTFESRAQYQKEKNRLLSKER